MNTMLQKAFTEVASRPDREQEEIASMVLEEVRKREALRELLLKRRASVAAGNAVDGETALKALHEKHFPNSKQS